MVQEAKEDVPVDLLRYQIKVSRKWWRISQVCYNASQKPVMI